MASIERRVTGEKREKEFIRMKRVPLRKRERKMCGGKKEERTEKEKEDRKQERKKVKERPCKEKENGNKGGMKNKERKKEGKKEGKGCSLLRKSDDGKSETEEKVLHQRLVQTHAKMQPFSVSMQNP